MTTPTTATDWLLNSDPLSRWISLRALLVLHWHEARRQGGRSPAASAAP